VFRRLTFKTNIIREYSLYLLYGIYGVLVTYPLIFLSVYVYKFGGIIATALIYAASAFSIGIAPIFISPLSDKTGFRIKYSNIFILLGSLLMLLSISLKDFVLPILIIASALLQVGQPLFISYETERNKNVGSSVGKFYIFINLGYLFGSLLFGLIISYFGFESTTIIFSLAGIVISIVFLRVKEERIYVKNPKKMSIIKALFSSKLSSLIYSSMVIVPALFFSIVPAYYVYFLNGNVLDWGIVNFTSTLTSVIASIYVGKIVDKIGVKKTLLVGSIYYPIYYLTLLFYPNQFIFAFLYSLPFWLFIWIPLYSYSAQISEVYERATFVSNMNFLIGIFRSFGGILGGLIVMFFDIYTFFILSILLSVLFPIFIKIYNDKGN